MKAEETPRPRPVAEPKRTPLENFIDGFPIDLARRTLSTDLAELFLGGDVSAYMNVRASEYLPTAVLPVRQPMMPLGKRPMPEIGSVQADTEHFGRLTLDAFLSRSDSYSQAYLVVHKGDIVYEQYPRMRREDNHLWMSSAKPTASLIIDMLISEGKIDEHAPITRYLTDFQGTDWDGITTLDVMDMATGMDVEDTSVSKAEPRSCGTSSRNGSDSDFRVRGTLFAVWPGGGRLLPLEATLPDRRPGAGSREIGPAAAETQRWRNEDDTPSWTSAPRRSRRSGTPNAIASTPSW